MDKPIKCVRVVVSCGGACTFNVLLCRDSPVERGFHTSSVLAGARNDSKKTLSPKVGYWIANQSKKAKKRFKRKQEAQLAKKPTVGTPNLASIHRALAVMKTDRQEAHRRNHFVIDGLRMQMPPPASPRERM